MSRIIRIPVNCKFSTNHTHLLNMTFILSNDLFNRFQTFEEYTEDLLRVNFSHICNTWLGEEIFSLNYPMYCKYDNETVAQKIYDMIEMSGNNITYVNESGTLTEVKSMNNFTFKIGASDAAVGIGYVDNQTIVYFRDIFAGLGGPTPLNYQDFYSTGEHSYRAEFSTLILPEDIFDTETGEADWSYYANNNYVLPQFKGQFDLTYDNINLRWNNAMRVHLTGGDSTFGWPRLSDLFTNGADNFSIKNSGANESDPNNPYTGEEGNSNPGGGDGTLPGGGLDFTDPTDFPDLPLVTSAAAGFISIYTPSITELQNLANFLWSGAFDLDTFKKLFTDPMEAIIGLGIVPAVPASSGTKAVKFGNVNSEVAMSYVDTQYVKVNCGSLKLDKYIGSFMDYSPYTKISIYLPYIGMRDLSPDDLIGGSIEVQYSIDILTGACACFIKHSSRGVLYSYNGSCIANIPLTGQSYSAAIQNAVSAVISGVGMVAGMATGAAPVTAMSAAGLINSAANTALNSKPTIQRSGNMGGSAGILSVQKPYVIIERPRLSVPSKVQNYVGQCANMTMNLGACSGYTIVEFCHIEGVPCTTEELTEIESLLKGGVIL